MNDENEQSLIGTCWCNDIIDTIFIWASSYSIFIEGLIVQLYCGVFLQRCAYLRPWGHTWCFRTQKGKNKERDS